MMKKDVTLPNGFTLIELMIVIVIIGIIAAFAYPSYRDSVLRSHRSDGQAGVLACAMAQERWFTQNTSYADQTTVNTNCDTTTTPPQTSLCDCMNTQDGYFSITIPSATAASFTAQATATSKDGQTDDTTCRSFSVNQAGTRSAKNAGGSDTTTTCWNN